MTTKNIKELKTTLVGVFVWILTGVYFFTPYFSDRKLWEVAHYEVTIGFLLGIGLILAPDRAIDFAFGWLNKKK